MSKPRLLVLGAVSAVLAACSDAQDPLRPPPLSDQLFLYAVLNADSARQRVEVSAVDHFLRPDLADVKVAIRKRTQGPGGTQWALVAEWDSARAAALGVSLTDHDRCVAAGSEWPHRIGPSPGRTTLYGRGLYCMTPELILEPGATYRVEATAEGRVRAWGETTVVGDFAIERAVLSSRSGTHSLEAQWTSSASAHRYFAAMRRRWGFCHNCFNGWTADMDSTRWAGPVPQIAVDSAGAVPMLDIAAVDRHFHAFLTSPKFRR